MKMNNTLTRALTVMGRKIKKCSPEILVVTGIIGLVGAAVIACKETTKVQGILDNTREQLQDVETGLKEETPDVYSEDDAKKDRAIIFAKTGLQFVKNYAPAVTLGAASIVCILAGNNILRKRLVSVTTAYAALDNTFKEYRDQVIEKFGKEMDRELRYKVKDAEVEETVTDDKGKEKKVKKKVKVTEYDGTSDYARFFDECNPNWQKDAGLNLVFLSQQQAYANERLRANGVLFLNEVYQSLGMSRTKAGQYVGWVYDKSKDAEGDGYVDFGLADFYRKGIQDFVDGYERSILLDFNVDGVIDDKLEYFEKM